jgi:hypothetical protein
MKLFLLIVQLIPLFSLKLCTNCNFFHAKKFSLFPVNDKLSFVDCNEIRKDICGRRGRYFEPLYNQPLELPDDYDFEIYIQLL